MKIKAFEKCNILQVEFEVFFSSPHNLKFDPK